jgi:hypothetical protein
MKIKLARAIITAAAIAFITAPITSSLAQAKTSKVPCYGVSACHGKSKSKCKTATHSCKGENGCKEKNVLLATPKHCKKLGGSVEKPEEQKA